jgi:hypothetical protein
MLRPAAATRTEEAKEATVTDLNPTRLLAPWESEDRHALSHRQNRRESSLV